MEVREYTRNFTGADLRQGIGTGCDRKPNTQLDSAATFANAPTAVTRSAERAALPQADTCQAPVSR